MKFPKNKSLNPISILSQQIEAFLIAPGFNDLRLGLALAAGLITGLHRFTSRLEIASILRRDFCRPFAIELMKLLCRRAADQRIPRPWSCRLACYRCEGQ
jgi:hypothetical protein